MSININHPQDDISTSDGDAPTLGGGFPSVKVMSTGTATATYYAKLATLAFPATNNVAANISLILTPKSASGSYPPVIVSATVLQGTSGLSTSSKVSMLSNDETAIGHDDLFLVTSAATNGTNIELHMQSIIAAAYDVQLLSSSFDTGVSISAWNDGATWTATDPTIAAAVSVTSEWAGSGQLTSTSLSNSTGTVYYEKSSDGIVNVHIELATITTTTDGTLLFTMPSGYRHNLASATLISVLTSPGATAGVSGRLGLTSDGAIKLYSYVAGSTTPWRASFTYRARA